MDKKAGVTVYSILIAVVPLLIIFLFFGVLRPFGGFFFGEKDSEEIKELNGLIEYISNDIDNIQREEQAYLITLDGANEYYISVKNCDNEAGVCKEGSKTKLCLIKTDIGKDFCSINKLDFAFNNARYTLRDGNMLISWKNNKLSLS